MNCLANNVGERRSILGPVASNSLPVPRDLSNDWWSQGTARIHERRGLGFACFNGHDAMRLFTF